MPESLVSENPVPRQWWVNLFSERPAFGRLPIDHVLTDVSPHHGSLEMRFSEATTKMVTAFIEAHGGAVEHLFLALFFAVIRGLTGSQDIVVTVYRNRSLDGSEQGWPANLFPLRRIITENEPFLTFYKSLAAMARKSARSRDKLEEIIQAIQADDVLVRQLLQHGYAFFEKPFDGTDSYGYRVRQQSDGVGLKHSLALCVFAGEEEMVLVLTYDASRYARQTAEKVLTGIDRLLATILQDTASVLPEMEEQQPEPLELLERELKKHPAVGKVAVIPCSCYSKKSEDVAVFYQGQGQIESQVRSFLREISPIAFERIQLVGLAEFPSDPAGHPDRLALLGKLAETPAASIEPLGPWEQAIGEVWKTVIGTEKEIGIDENFLAVGGNSLKALRVISGIYERFQVQLELKTLYDAWTIRKLAMWTKTQHEQGVAWADGVMPGDPNPEGLYPPSHAQQRLYGVSQFDAASKAYNIRQAFRLSDDMNLERLRTAITVLVSQYEILRTVFVHEDDQLWQKIVSPPDIDELFLYLSPAQSATVQPAVYLESLPTILFDLSHGPLFNIRYLDQPGKGKYLLVSLHHIISDFWSLTVIFAQIERIYRALEQGGRVEPFAPKIQYRDFAAWQNKLLEFRRAELIAYWKEKLAVCPQGTRIPLDLPRPQLRSYKGHIEQITLDPAMTDRLRQICETGQANLMMGIFTIFSILLYRYTMQERNIVIIHLAGRDKENFKDQIGLFVNTLPLFSEIYKEEDFGAALRRNMNLFLEAYEMQYYPFDLLLSDLKIKWAAGELPLSGIGYNWIYNDGAVNKEGLGEAMPLSGTGTSKYDLLFTGIERRDQLVLSLEFNTDVYLTSTMELLLQEMEELIWRFDYGADTRIAHLLAEVNPQACF